MRHCKECGRPIRARWTKSGLCNECRIAHMRENAIQLKQRKGEYYERWLRGMKEFYERVAEEDKRTG